MRMVPMLWLLVALFLEAGQLAHAQDAWQVFELQPAPSPLDNPLKGLVPYTDPGEGSFPHSLEFSYMPLSRLMKGPNTFDWRPLEKLLNDIASRGNQAVVRVFLEYPNRTEGIPNYLEQAGVKVHEYLNTNTQPFPPKKVRTPDYNDLRLVEALETFIAEWGKRYDGDPRLGYLHAGLLGTWGEWHTYPRDDLWASKKTQAAVLDAFEKAFKKTPVLLRYPAGDDDYAQVANSGRPFGYHDDSFAWATLETGKEDDSWFYMHLVNAAGVQDKWQRHPIGGEIRPEVWGLIFDDRSKWPEEAQDIAKCLEETHASWLMDTGMFQEPPSAERQRRAAEFVRRMGYDFYIRGGKFSLSEGRLQVELNVFNQGVAPFYADWNTEICIAPVDRKSNRWTTVADTASFQGLQPSEQAHQLSMACDAPQLDRGTYALLLRVAHPLPRGKPLRFANASQDDHLLGWLTLAEFKIE